MQQLIINILKSRGLIDGIGIQCHQFNMDTVSVSTMKSVLNTLSSTGLPIYVSELDITGDDATQLARYKEKFPVLWENSNVKGITLWGYIQGQTWINNTHLISSTGVERPALTWLKSYLAKNNTDVEVPTSPTNLTSSKTTLGAVSLSWTASTDNVGVTSYDIYNGSILVGTSKATSYTVTGLSPNTTYSFTVIAKDAAGNASASSNKLSVTTITEALKGDADSNGEVNVLDYVLLQKYINDPTSVSINSVNSDLNGDTRINTADLFELRKIVLAG